MAGQVQDLGLALFISLLQASAGRPKYVGWGIGTGAAVNATNMVTPATEPRTNGSTSIQTTTIAGDTYRVIALLTADADKVITEIGIFDAAGSGSPPAGGNMAFYSSFLPLSIETGDTITFTNDVIFERAP